MDGLEAIEEIMAFHAIPILVVTTMADARTAYAAISKGALDLVAKPDINIETAKEFIAKIKLISKISVITHISGRRTKREVKEAPAAVFDNKTADKIVSIAASTGGPDALSVILSSLHEKFPCPIVIAQHITDGFVTGMVEWLKGICPLKVKVAVDGEPLEAGTAYISRSEKHMVINNSKKIAFLDRSPKDLYRPSCDALLTSVASVYGSKSIGIILTGMGTDGVLGMKKIKEAGGLTISQDEKSSIVFGMPKAAIDSGCIDKVLSLGEISIELERFIGKKIFV
jgi:two-component system chemotaxis response regulator CheB